MITSAGVATRLGQIPVVDRVLRCPYEPVSKLGESLPRKWVDCSGTFHLATFNNATEDNRVAVSYR